MKFFGLYIWIFLSVYHTTGKFTVEKHKSKFYIKIIFMTIFNINISLKTIDKFFDYFELNSQNTSLNN